MSNTSAVLRRKITAAGDLRSVVRAMKGIAASNIGRCDQSVSSTKEYFRAVELGLGACLREKDAADWVLERKGTSAVNRVGAVIIGTDQGLVGQFNDVVAEDAMKTFATFPSPPEVWVVGERLDNLLTDAGLSPKALLNAPNSVEAVIPLVGRILVESMSPHGQGELSDLHLFYNRPTAGSLYAPVHQRLLPLDEIWRTDMTGHSWPDGRLPEVLGGNASLRDLISEYLFIAIFRACTESLASENASRLAAMSRADKNIGELLEDLTGQSHRFRQGGIDEELFDVITGFEALSAGVRK
jgi:F-type H+-transporting ATPase subunit gamma